MKKRIENALVYLDGSFKRREILISKGRIADISDFVNDGSDPGGVVFDFKNCFVFPGLTDVYVHLREPGFFYKETVKTGAAYHIRKEETL